MDIVLRQKYNRTVIFLILLVIIIMSIGWAVWGFLTPVLSDDLIYTCHYRDVSGRPLPVLRFMFNMWRTVNARFGDLTNCVWLSIVPRPITALLCGIGTGVSLWGCLKLAGIKRCDTFAASVVTLALIAVLPWWDMNLFVCNFNYVWGTALLSLILLPLFNNKLKSKWWLFLLPLISAGTAIHEAQGFPISVGLGVYLWLTRSKRNWNKVQKWWCMAILAGGLFSVTSPASYARVGWDMQPDYPWYGMLFAVLPMVCVLVIRCIWLSYKGDIRQLLFSRWTIFATASLVSAGFTLIGGIDGRGGWYAQVFAIIALAIDFKRYENKRELTRSKALYSLVFAIFSVIVAVIQVGSVINNARTMQAILRSYQENPHSEQTVQSLKALNDPWFEASMALTVNEPMSFGTYYYAPVSLSKEEKNPALPLIEI